MDKALGTGTVVRFASENLTKDPTYHQVFAQLAFSPETKEYHYEMIHAADDAVPAYDIMFDEFSIRYNCNAYTVKPIEEPKRRAKKEPKARNVHRGEWNVL